MIILAQPKVLDVLTSLKHLKSSYLIRWTFMLQLKTLVLKLLVDQSSNSYRAIFTLGHLLTSSYMLLEDIISVSLTCAGP